MLSLFVAVACSQLPTDFPPPPPPPPAHVRIEAPSAQLQEISELRHLAVSLRTQLNLSRQVSELSVEIATFDTSGPGWAKSLRVISYLLVIPTLIFTAPIFSGNTAAGMTASLVAPQQTASAMTPTFNLVGLGMAIAVGAAFVFGVTGGVVGWLKRSFELDAMVQHKAALDEEWAALRIEGDSLAMGR